MLLSPACEFYALIKLFANSILCSFPPANDCVFAEDALVKTGHMAAVCQGWVVVFLTRELETTLQVNEIKVHKEWRTNHLVA